MRRTTPQESQVVSQWQRRVRAEGLCLAGVLLCTAVLLHGIPPRQVDHSLHAHTARLLWQQLQAALVAHPGAFDRVRYPPTLTPTLSQREQSTIYQRQCGACERVDACAGDTCQPVDQQT